MRTFQAITILLILAAMPATAQVQEGPLAEPSLAAPPPAKAKAVKKPAKKKASAAARTKAADGTPDAAAPEASVPTSQAAHRGTTTTDPISFGMKWNGSNDTAERTRVQNYNGDATGAGAAAGFKLHF